MTDKCGFIGCCNFKENGIKNDTDKWLKSQAFKNKNTTVLYCSQEILIAAYGIENDIFSSYVDDDVCVVFFGEIYRKNANVADSNNNPHKKPLPSSFLLAQSYKLFDSSGIFKLEGIFCVLIFDIKQKKVLIYKDDSSFKFLYYHHDSKSGFSFSTDLDLLLTKPNLEKRIAHGALHEYLRTFMIYPPNTIYEDVFAVTPGCIVEYSENTPKIQTPPNPDRIDSSDLSFEQCVNEFNDLMTESVRRRIKGTDEPAFFLSGGLDSSLLCCIGKAILGSDINAFTIGFEDPKYDESNRAAEIANYLKIKHHKLILEQKNYMGHFHKLVEHSDQPFADPSGTPTFYAFDLIKEYTRAIIDGTGADSLIGTMPPRYKRVATQYVSLFPKSMRELSRKFLIYTKYFKNYEDLFDFEEPLDLLIMWKAWRKSEIEKLCNEDVDLEQNILYRIYREYHRSQHFERYSEMYRYSSDDRIHQAGRMFSVNVRFPYWDQNVQSFVNSLRKDFRYKGGEEKRIIRAALEKHVPKEMLNVKRHAFIFPIEEFMRQKKGELIHTYLNERALKMHELFDYKIVKSTVDRFLDGDNSMKFKVWSLIIFQAWYENHF